MQGSWVNRSARVFPPGARARCRHCRVPYVVGKGDPCRGRTEHEPDVVLKDNDFTTKITLRPEQAVGPFLGLPCHSCPPPRACRVNMPVGPAPLVGPRPSV